MRILLDFDRTLCPDALDVRPTEPPPDAARTLLLRAREAGHEIVVLSARGRGFEYEGWRWRAARREIAEYLDRHDVPYDEIEIGCADGDVRIDTRAIAFDGKWSKLGLSRLRYFAPR
ncbi:MAG: hypothetical protein ACYTGN_09995 [Planctomycetota bacterium]|jgi:hypothetical protein